MTISSLHPRLSHKCVFCISPSQIFGKPIPYEPGEDLDKVVARCVVCVGKRTHGVECVCVMFADTQRVCFSTCVVGLRVCARVV